MDFLIFRRCDLCGRWKKIKQKNFWYKAIKPGFKLPKRRGEGNAYICKTCYIRIKRREKNAHKTSV